LPGVVLNGDTGKTWAQQPDAKTITHAPEPEMRSAFEAVGETVPQRCDGER
jgi:hypothetical protein